MFHRVFIVLFYCILQKTFHYDSPFWNNKKEYGIPEGETGLDKYETKLPTYVNGTSYVDDTDWLIS